MLNDRLANVAGYSEDYYAITLSEVNAQDEEKSVLDGRLVLADRATTEADPVGATDPAYYVGANGMAFDLSTIRDADCMNGGFGPFGTAVISGVAWDDANYDGIRNYKIIGGETEEDGSVAVRSPGWGSSTGLPKAGLCTHAPAPPAAWGA